MSGLRLRLRQRFALLVMLIYLLAAAASWLAYRLINRELVDVLAVNYAQKQALYDNAAMRQPIVRELALTRQMTRSPLLLRWVRNENDATLRAAALAELEAFRQTFNDHSWFVAIESSRAYYYNDRDNAYAERTPAHYLHSDDSNDDWYFQTLRRVDDYALNVDYDSFSGTTKIWINAILREGDNKLGVVGSGLDLSEFLAAHVLDAPPGTATVLIDGKGATEADRDLRAIVLNSLAQSDADLRTYFDLLDVTADRQRLREQLARIRRGEVQAATLFVQMGGRPHLIGAAYMPEIDWYNLSVIDLGQFQSPTQIFPLLLVSAASLLFGVLAVAWLLNRLVLRRLTPLFAAADRMAQGDYSVHLSGGDDEIGRLSQGFERMAGAVREATAQLEARVDERTQALQEKTELLARQKDEIEQSHNDLKAAQLQLVQQGKMASLGTLTAGVAHEINNPTNFADGAVQNLAVALERLHAFLRDLAGDDAPAEVLQAFEHRFAELREMLDTAREGHVRIKAIVRDLRQFSRLDEAERKTIRIAEPIQSTVNLVRTRFDRIAFELDLDHNPEIECQPAKLGQVFMNLIINACEAIESGETGGIGRIRLTTAPARRADGEAQPAVPAADASAMQGLAGSSDAAVTICIEDNGHGMDLAIQERIFEPFFTTKPVGAGTGLGLAIVFGIVREHGGQISVDSQPGRGSRFLVWLPVKSSNARHENASSAP